MKHLPKINSCFLNKGHCGEKEVLSIPWFKTFINNIKTNKPHGPQTDLLKSAMTCQHYIFIK